jgi:hypothetical protein
MRIKSLVAAVGLSVATAVVLGPAVANASRGSRVEPNIEVPAEPVEETPAAPVEPAAPAEETPTAPEVVEVPAPPVVEEAPAAPVVKKPAAPAPTTPPVVGEAPAAPVVAAPVAPAPIVPVEAKKAPPAPAPAKPDQAPKQADPCHMDSYEPVTVASLSGGEAARAQKVDRNGNGTVCRKAIPGKGKGNTGQGSNIKDDQVR